MAITSINSTPISPSIPESAQKSQDLSESIKENLSKSVKYQIIDKMLSSDKSSEKQEQNLTAKNDVSKTDSVTLSFSAIAITKSTIEFSGSTIFDSSMQNQNTSTNIQTSAQNLEQSSARLSFSSEAAGEVKRTDPLAFDLNGNGIETTGIKQGIQFDIDADGETEQTSFISGGDAFLAYDKNGNGIIDNGSELFGDQNGAANGFEELKKYDENHDGIIDKNDAIYSQLTLLSVDQNNQLKTSSLTEHNIESINLNYNNQHQAINYYDSVEQTSSFKRSDGTSGYAADIMLGHK
ncbi:MAG: hypothetical protein QM504_04635 [Pseudomonadota bacterium]